MSSTSLLLRDKGGLAAINLETRLWTLAVSCLVSATSLTACISTDAPTLEDTRITAACSAAPARPESARHAHIELLVAAFSNIPSRQWDRDRQAARTVIAIACSAPGTTLEIRPITSNSYAEPAAFKGIAPAQDASADVNPLVFKARQRAFVNQAVSALDHLRYYPASHPSDLMGAIKIATDTLSVVPTEDVRIVIVAHHLWAQGPPEDLYQFGDDPRRHLHSYMAKLQASAELPDAKNVTFYLAGLSSGPSGMATTGPVLQELCAFWEQFIVLTGGELPKGGCQPDLPDDLIRHQLLLPPAERLSSLHGTILGSR